jgi:Ca2+-binding RTX toxin-like protein
VATALDGNDCYNGGSGIDTLDSSAITAAATINLNGSATSSQTGKDRLSSIENATGGSGNDRMTGSKAANILEGGFGDDIMDGVSGNDTFVFRPDVGNDVVKGFDATRREVRTSSTFRHSKSHALISPRGSTLTTSGPTR